MYQRIEPLPVDFQRQFGFLDDLNPVFALLALLVAQFEDLIPEIVLGEPLRYGHSR